jgi:hypothetical protein
MACLCSATEMAFACNGDNIFELGERHGLILSAALRRSISRHAFGCVS